MIGWINIYYNPISLKRELRPDTTYYISHCWMSLDRFIIGFQEKKVKTDPDHCIFKHKHTHTHTFYLHPFQAYISTRKFQWRCTLHWLRYSNADYQGRCREPWGLSMLADVRGGGVNWTICETKKAQINSVGWQHTRVDNSKTNKAPASRFCSTAGYYYGFTTDSYFSINPR